MYCVRGAWLLRELKGRCAQQDRAFSMGFSAESAEELRRQVSTSCVSANQRRRKRLEDAMRRDESIGLSRLSWSLAESSQLIQAIAAALGYGASGAALSS